jgi:prepilin-type processing-associated H-X9-DG protein
MFKPFALYASSDIGQKLKSRGVAYGYPWEESAEYLLATRGGGGLLVGIAWGLVLWMIYGAPVRRSTIARIREEVAQARQEVARQREAVAALSDAPLEPLPPPAAPARKEYRGEYYPVEKPHHAFALVELLVVLGIIAILIAMMLPLVRRAREMAKVTTCANNVHQAVVAMQEYLVENQQMTFWRGKNLDTEGMDWWAWGGQETGNANHEPADYFNTMIPRPLNKYVANRQQIFHCPEDDAAPWTHDLGLTIWEADSQFEWVGNSYAFNAVGYPLRPPPRKTHGLAGVKFGSVAQSSRTVLFYEGCLYYGFDWHFGHRGNVAFCDGHIEFIPLPVEDQNHKWDP